MFISIFLLSQIKIVFLNALTFCKNFMRCLLLIILTITFIGCNSSDKDSSSQQDYYTPKTLLLESYDIPKLNSKAKKEIQNWKGFRTFYGVMTNLAPNNIMSDPNLLVKDKDSLIIFKRLYLRSPKAIEENVYVDKDWHTPKVITDTIYRLTCDDKTKLSYIGWKEKLISKIPYIFTCFAKASNSNEITLKIAKEDSTRLKSNVLLSQTFLLDSINYSQNLSPQATSKLIDEKEKWFELELEYTPNQDGTYQFEIELTQEDMGSSTKNLLVYSPSIKIKNGDIKVIQELSSDLVDTQTKVRSSYYSVYFWLDQMEDELNQLLVRNQFPEKLNTSILKSRFNLLNTRIKELKDKVKNSTQLDDKQVSDKILTIEKGFGHIISSINTVYDDNLDNLMNSIEKDLEKLQKISIQSSSLENLQKNSVKR